MRIAILSDIHDNVWKLDAALAEVRETGAGALVCCGDLCAPFVVSQLAEGFPGPVHVVFGNNDGDGFRITRTAAEHDNLTLHGEFAELELAGTRAAVHHLPEVGRPLVRSGRYDLVCYGHTHEYEEVREEGAVGVNPGEIMGRLGTPTFCVYDTDTGTTTRYEVP